MDVSHFGLFDIPRRLLRPDDPASGAPAARAGSGRIANDNAGPPGARRMPDRLLSVFRLMPRHGQEPGPA
jgi:hypothetical protein